MSALEWLQQSGESEAVIELAQVIYANDFGTSLRNLGVQEMKVHTLSLLLLQFASMSKRTAL
eukprot:284764-Pyramimonas_sp.AAC.1